ncbi:MAG: histidine--tRNA ligase [Candidatus Nanohaloarchaea archaeon]
MTDVKGLKGFYDRYPDEFASWRKLIETVEEAAREFGFNEIGTPSVERADLYRVKSGEELMEQMYSFDDKGGREISLIPEQTPTRARMVQSRKDLKSPVKWFDTSKRWRYENVQKGRDREFFQTDIDIFGVESVEADAEVIACAARIYRKLDLENRVEFLINNRQLLESILDVYGIDQKEAAMKVIDDKEKMTREEFIEELREEADLPKSQARQVDELTDISGPIQETVEELRDKVPADSHEAVDRMEELADMLEAYGVEDMCRLDLSIVRGLAYYTGLVFEAFDSEGELRALFGGGRYDTLVGLFGSREVPAVGFAFGYSTTIELLRKEGRWPLAESETDVYVLSASRSVYESALGFARELRQQDLSVETDIAGRSFGSQLEYADSINAKRVLIVGERDLDNDEVTIKHMDSGDEEKVDRDKVVEHFRSEDLI